MASGISFPAQTHLDVVLAGLRRTGWIVTAVPDAGRLPRNDLKIELRLPASRHRFRLLAYAIGGSSRDSPGERRLQITTTYKKNLEPAEGFTDVVLGLDDDTGTLVGVDPRRLAHGGSTANASTFVDLQGLHDASDRTLHVRPRASELFGVVEYQAYFAPTRIAEYLLNLQSVHAGTYSSSGPFSGRLPGPTKRNGRPDDGPVLTLEFSRPAPTGLPDEELVRAVERNDQKRLSRAALAPAALARILRRIQDNGVLGEKIVLQRERKRLAAGGRLDLSKKVRWVSRYNVSAGFDILSFDPSGQKRYLEVKSSESDTRVFLISANEWRVAAEEGAQYSVVRVSGVRSRTPKFVDIDDPVRADAKGTITRTPADWWVRG